MRWSPPSGPCADSPTYSKPAFPACSRWAMPAAAARSGSLPPWARARSRSPRCTRYWPSRAAVRPGAAYVAFPLGRGRRGSNETHRRRRCGLNPYTRRGPAARALPSTHRTHRVAERLQVPRDPLALRARLEQDLRPRPTPEHRGEALAARDDPAFGDGPVLITEAELTLALVQIQSYDIHGGWPPGGAPRRKTVSAFPYCGALACHHVTVEVQPAASYQLCARLVGGVTTKSSNYAMLWASVS